MRNLKRALSLALASVMLLGMMVVGSSAKGLDDFSDNAEIVNKDAVAVTSAIGLFDGYEDGSFGPENVVTRAEMAVIICTMLYGAGVNVNQFAETNVFTDVPAWAQGYVNLCSSLGIVAGVGDGKFDPNATVTTAQAVLMLCRALGYFQSAADFGNDWMLAATAKGTALGLYGDLKLTANAGLTRDNVAELVFNALTKAVPVQYNELLGVYYNENQGIIYSLEFNYLQTLGYKNFDLVYKTNTETIYGRPATTWGTGSYNARTDAGTTQKDEYLTENGGLIADKVRMLDKDEIITVPNTPDYVYTANTDEQDVYKDLGATVCNNARNQDEEYTWTVFVNGEEVFSGVTNEAKDGEHLSKRLWAAVGILAALLAAALGTGWWVDGLTADYVSRLEQAQAMSERGDWERAAQVTGGVYRNWQERSFWLHALLRHSDTDQVLLLFRSVEEYLKLEEMDQYAAANAQLIAQLELLAEMEDPSLENVL